MVFKHHSIVFALLAPETWPSLKAILNRTRTGIPTSARTSSHPVLLRKTPTKPNRWRRLWTLRSEQVEFTDSVLRLLAPDDGQAVSVSMTVELPPDVDYLTFMVRMSSSELSRGSGPNAGGGVVFSFIDQQGNRRQLPRIDPNYSGYRRMNEYIKTARAQGGDRKLKVQIEVVDATGSLEIEKIHVTRSEPEYVLSDRTERYSRTHLLPMMRLRSANIARKGTAYPGVSHGRKRQLHTTRSSGLGGRRQRRAGADSRRCRSGSSRLQLGEHTAAVGMLVRQAGGREGAGRKRCENC